VLLGVVAVLLGGARLWAIGPDAVHITITGGSTITDRTIHNSEVAQRLQRDLAAMQLMPYWEIFAPTSCSAGPPGHDAYTLTWYRAGLPVEQANVDDADCGFWREDGVLFHRPYGEQVLYADIDAALRVGT
jgi:hypothetical protein